MNVCALKRPPQDVEQQRERREVVYQLYELPSDWEYGHYALPQYDRGRVGIMVAYSCDMTQWTMAISDDLSVQARMKEPMLVGIDCYGLIIEGVGLEDERVVWRLEPRDFRRSPDPALPVLEPPAAS